MLPKKRLRIRPQQGRKTVEQTSFNIIGASSAEQNMADDFVYAGSNAKYGIEDLSRSL